MYIHPLKNCSKERNEDNMSDYGFAYNAALNAQVEGNYAAAKVREDLINRVENPSIFDFDKLELKSFADDGTISPNATAAPTTVYDEPTGNNLDINELNTTTMDPACTDGCDDGKLSFGDTVGSFFKGLVSPITNMFSSPENFIKGALTVVGGGLLVAATGGAATPLLVAAGVGAGVFNVAKGAIGAANATTDAEAKGAWEDIGAGTGMIAGSVAGAKTAAKAAGKAGVAGFENAESMSSLQATKACITGAGKSFSASLKSFTSGAWKTNLGFGKNITDEPKTTEAQGTQEVKTDTKALTEKAAAQDTKTAAQDTKAAAQDTKAAAQDTKTTTNEKGLSNITEENGLSSDVKDISRNSSPNNQTGSSGNAAKASGETKTSPSAQEAAAEWETKMKNAQTKKEFKTIYRNAARKFHPDYAEKNGYTVTFATEAMKQINMMHDMYIGSFK